MMNPESMENQPLKELRNACQIGATNRRKLCHQSAKKDTKDVLPSSLLSLSTKCHKELLNNQSSLSNENVSTSYSTTPSISTSFLRLKQDLKRYLNISYEYEFNKGAKKRRVEKRQKEAKRELLEQEQKMKELRQFYKTLSSDQQIAIFKKNFTSKPENPEAAIERFVDISLFGPPRRCTYCKNGQIYYDSEKKTYVCSGYATQYTKCMFNTRYPVRTLFRLPKEMDGKPDYEGIQFNDLFVRYYSPEDNIIFTTRSNQSFRNNIAEEIGNKENIISPVDGQIYDTENCLIIKKGNVVDSKFPHPEQFHIYEDKTVVYSATLVFTDIMCNKNSYCKIQLLNNDYQDLFYLFLSWGRIGTLIGNTFTKSYECLKEAKTDFENIFFEKTRNQWERKTWFEKQPGSFNLIELDRNLIKKLGETDLSESVRKLMNSIFNIQRQDQLWPIKYFDIDATYMPLGKVSSDAIHVAKQVLYTLQKLVKTPEVNQFKIIDLSNKFYNIIPHDFGMNVPEPIASTELIDAKLDFLRILSDTGKSLNQITQRVEVPIDTDYDLVKNRYVKLRYDVELLDPNCEEHLIISNYVMRTHGSTHRSKYFLMDIYEVRRSNGNDKNMKAIGNRMLLWHGSKKVNFAGILKRGLMIAPNGPAVSGYMFGKGVYFADMFSKSLGYCHANNNEEAYVLLCEVALGKPCQVVDANKHMNAELLAGSQYQSVQGLGKERPTLSMLHPNGYSIPLGEPKAAANAASLKLKYNEYIVYNTNQFEIRYLVKVRVNTPPRG